MKNLVLTALLIFSSNFIFAQWFALPDTNFRNYLINNGFTNAFNVSKDSINSLDPNVLATTSIICGNKQIKKLDGVEAFTNLIYLSAPYNNIDSIGLLPNSLLTLELNYNFTLNFIAGFPPNLNTLDIEATNLPISYLSSLPASLERLSLRNNNYTYLPTLPLNLIYLNCSYNPLTSLPNLPATLTALFSSNNNLTALPNLPNVLETLLCSNNQLSTLPALPSTLTNLTANNNLISTLPALPNSITQLGLANNLLTNLPNLPSTLLYAELQFNQLTVLPAIPPALMYMYCNDNQLTYLPQFPVSTQAIFCSNNLIDSVAILPDYCNTIDFSFNKITQLPNIPLYAGFFLIHSNPIHELPAIVNINQLHIYNTNITCLPKLPTYFADIRLDTNNIKCLPNIINATIYQGNYTTPIQLPLCDGATPCFVGYNIYGKAYYDSSANCNRDSTESYLKNIKVSLLDKSNGLIAQTITNNFGEYSFKAPNLDTFFVQVDTLNTGLTSSCNNALLKVTLTVLDSIEDMADLALVCGGTVNDRSADAIVVTNGFHFPVDTLTLTSIVGQQLYCNMVTGGTVTLKKTGPVKFISQSTIWPAIVTKDSIVWTIANFDLLNTFTGLPALVVVDTFFNGASTACYQLIVNTNTADDNPTNNTTSACFNLVNSYDPNDKQVSPTGNVLPSNNWLTYTVRFQNTGTANARNIVIRDTLDKNLQLNTFELLSYSFKPDVSIDAKGATKFAFVGINLPDSNTNEVASHGYITYRIKQKQGLPLGTTIKNTAHIYFDFNAAIITNTTTNTISNQPNKIEPVTLKSFQITPNPTQNFIHITSLKPILKVQVIDMVGKVVLEQFANKNFKTKISLENLQDAYYIINLLDTDGNLLHSKVKVQH